MVWYDIVILIILAFTTFRGASRGLVWQLAWIGALIMCFFFAESLSLQLAPHIKVEPPLNRWIAMFILYMGSAFLSFGIARVLRGWIEKAKFQEFDRHLGGLFGLVKGVIVGVVLTFFVVTLSEGMRATVLRSHSGHAAAVIMSTLRPVMPNELGTVIDPYLDNLRDEDFHPGDVAEEHDHFNFDDLLNMGKNGQGTEQGSETNPILNRNDESRQANSGMTLGDLIAKLPGTVGNEVKQRTIDALKNATPEQQQQLIDGLKSSAGNHLNDVLTNWTTSLSGLATPPASSGRNGFIPANGREQPGRNPIQPASSRKVDLNPLLQKIAAVYSDVPSVRNEIVADIQGKLEGIPADIAEDSLVDWYADLIPGNNDPDPATKFTTHLEERLVRQLARARVPMDRLSLSAQRRLRDAARN